VNCIQASRLLPLWVGGDLSDTREVDAIRSHLALCRPCLEWQQRLQRSLGAMQTVATEAAAESSLRPSLWPRVVAVLPSLHRRRDRFNGWIPVSVMALAALLMVAVSITSVHRELREPQPLVWHLGPPSPSNGRNLFDSDSRFAPHPGSTEPLETLLLPAANKFPANW